MVICGVIDYGKTATINKTNEVNGLHKVPSSVIVRGMKWLHPMKIPSPYPINKHFFICGLR